MANDIFEKDGLVLTSYCGPVIDDLPRSRIQITLDLNPIRGLMPEEVKELFQEAIKAIEDYMSGK